MQGLAIPRTHFAMPTHLPLPLHLSQPQPQPQQGLHPLLDAACRLGPEYGGSLSSHLPMVLSALHALGADAQRLRQCLELGATRFTPSTDLPSATPLADWLARRGQWDAYRPLLAHFRAALARQGPDEVLRQAIPALLPGVSAAAFHGAIRLAHAVRAGHSDEMACALAYWACRWQLTAAAEVEPALVTRRDGLCFSDWSGRALAAMPLAMPAGALIADRMQVVARTPAFAALAGRLETDGDTLPALASMAVKLYLRSRSFTVLHLVTACHAVRTLQPWMADPGSDLRHLGDAFLAAMWSTAVDPTRPPLTPDPADSRGWPALAAAAMAQQDDHVIKLVHSCREEAAAYPASEGTYLQSARLALSA